MKRDSSPCIDIQNLEFAWENDVSVLRIDKFVVQQGERLFLKGPSGSGKSTLLGVVAGVFSATSGEVNILGKPFHTLSAADRDRLRADDMGVIFQQFNLVPYLTLVENVLLPCRFSPVRASRVAPSENGRVAAAIDLLGCLGLTREVSDKRSAAELSVGQQQRVAAARALIGGPSLIIADEPTSALDTQTRDSFIETLITEAKGAAVVFVSHDASLADRFDRTVTMDELNLIRGETKPPLTNPVQATIEA
ncbi:MAG: ABC transporter ATP-binding protein [Pseudomonadota bacterium]